MAETNERRFCMCIAPEPRTDVAKRAMAGRKAAILNEFKWGPAAQIRVKFFAGEGDQQLRDRVRKAAEQWRDHANLTFSWVGSDQAADVRIGFVQGDGSWSYLGTYCQTIASAERTMNYAWLTLGSSDTEVRSVVLHEFGHALGLIHEHQNPKKAIQWNEAAVIRDLSGPPNNWDLATIRHNVLDRYDPAKVTATNVDPSSIMMYPIPKSWTLDGFSAAFNSDLSADDKKLIKASYP